MGGEIKEMMGTEFLHNPGLIHIDRVKISLGEVLCFLPKKNNKLVIVGFLRHNKEGKDWLIGKNGWKFSNEINTNLPVSIVTVIEEDEERCIVKEDIKNLFKLKEEQIYIWKSKDVDGQDRVYQKLLREEKVY